jgi:hypothetical protein
VHQECCKGAIHNFERVMHEMSIILIMQTRLGVLSGMLNSKPWCYWHQRSPKVPNKKLNIIKIHLKTNIFNPCFNKIQKTNDQPCYRENVHNNSRKRHTNNLLLLFDHKPKANKYMLFEIVQLKYEIQLKNCKYLGI